VAPGRDTPPPNPHSSIDSGLLTPELPPQTPIVPLTETPTYGYEVLRIHPHDREAFTQGLVFEDGFLFEGTGLRGRSSLRRVELETGTVLQYQALADHYFGEGIAIFGERIVQLTWQSQTGIVYDKASFAPVRTFSYTGEGWGLTHDGQRLIMSDGSASLRFLDPHTFQETGRLDVYDDSGPVYRLNELEYVGDQVLANVWQTNRIARIDLETGQVIAYIDLSGLLQPEDYSSPVDVLNGIAYDQEGDRLFVTGKLWPKLFEIRLVPPHRSFLPLLPQIDLPIVR
jgi:glutamine cyclotransferase